MKVKLVYYIGRWTGQNHNTIPTDYHIDNGNGMPLCKLKIIGKWHKDNKLGDPTCVNCKKIYFGLVKTKTI